MSKSLRRVEAVLRDAGVPFDLKELDQSTQTAQMAADALGVDIDQIAKSIVVEGAKSGILTLFITAGGNRVEMDRVAGLLGEPTHPASGKRVRDVTGFAIGGVSPIGHKTPIRAYLDPDLETFEQIWAAAGTPRHVFGIDPASLLSMTQAQRARFTENR